MATEASFRIFSIDLGTQVQAANWLAIPYDSAFGYANLTQIACLQISFVPELVGRIGSSKPVLLPQSDHPVWK
jgi:hypothetical protein